VYRQKLLAGKWKENSQIFNEDFYLPLYLPLWPTTFKSLKIPSLSVQKQGLGTSCTMPYTFNKVKYEFDYINEIYEIKSMID
jgi:hypothetical protein